MLLSEKKSFGFCHAVENFVTQVLFAFKSVFFLDFFFAFSFFMGSHGQFINPISYPYESTFISLKCSKKNDLPLCHLLFNVLSPHQHFV
jgi:hypothetical protein